MSSALKVTILGSGTSVGVPQIGCPCPVCHSDDPHDRRLRASALLETDDGRRLLIDCGPDFRQQMMGVDFLPLDGVLFTHEHYDHTGGIDDLRPFTRTDDGLPLYADEKCAKHIRERLPYLFREHLYPGVPRIRLEVVQPGVPFVVEDFWEVMPIPVMHGKLPILGFRIGDFAYITDMTEVPADALHLLQGVRFMVVNALREKPHPTHQGLSQALDFVKQIGVEKAWLTHCSHEIGFHREVQSRLPEGVYLSFDGLSFRI